MGTGRFVLVTVKPKGEKSKRYLLEDGTSIEKFLQETPNLFKDLDHKVVLVNSYPKPSHYILREGDIMSTIPSMESIKLRNKKRNSTKKLIEIFLSYAMADSERFQIPKIAKGLEAKSPHIKVNYWEGWDGYPNGDIIEFMEQKVEASAIFVQFCTEASKESKNCEDERKMASYRNKKIIPIFKNIEFVPEIFKHKIGIDISTKTIPQIIEEYTSR